MGKAELGLTKVTFIERWPSYRMATINRFTVCRDVEPYSEMYVSATFNCTSLLGFHTFQIRAISTVFRPRMLVWAKTTGSTLLP